MNVTKAELASELDTKTIKNYDNQKFITSENTNGIELSFRDLNYSIRPSFFSNEKKKLLSNVSGSFRTGELTAIMGPSGAGKTVLMDILAGFVTKSVRGDIMINGRIRNLNAFRRLSAYIMQYHVLHELLTVQESMHVAAELKLSASTAYKKERINILLKDLGLDLVRTTLAGDLSTGQKKRLAIAMELISDQPVMFFDEPTSGLDSVTTKQCIELMKSLAQTGRMVICTIHQPSASLLNMMDNIYVIAKGRCIYTGGPENMIPFLSSVGLHCPEYHNPADFLLEVASGDYGDHIARLSEASKNGTYRSIASGNVSCALDSPSEKLSMDLLQKYPAMTTAFHAHKARREHNYASSSFKQTRVLLWRYILKACRDRGYIMGILIAHLVMAVVTGLTFHKVGQDAGRAIDNVKQLDFNLLFISFCAINSALITFPSELNIMTREYFNRWYKLRSVYIANNIINFVTLSIAVSGYTLLTYFLSDQLLEFRRFGCLLLISVSIALVNQVVGLLISVNLNVKNVVFLGPYSVMPFVLFSGVFVRQRDVHPYLSWIYDISVFKYAYQGSMSSIFGFDRERMKCMKDYCHFSSPSAILYFIGADDSYWPSAITLIAVFLTLHLLTYISLRIKLKTMKFR